MLERESDVDDDARRRRDASLVQQRAQL